MQEANLYLFVGYPGAGKTTVANWLAEATGAEHIWVDKIRHERYGVVYDQSDSPKLYDQLNAQAAELLQAGRSVIFDTNFNFRKDRDHLRQIAAQAGACTVLIWITTPYDIAEQRAVHVTGSSGSRRYIDMSKTDFDRIVRNLEPPSSDEHPIQIAGIDLSKEMALSRLGLAA